MTEVECPLCEEYEGPVQSVEAHISSNTCGEHQGHAGSEFREELREQAAERAASRFREFASPDPGGGGASPGLALVVATAVLVVAALGSDRDGGGESVEPEQGGVVA